MAVMATWAHRAVYAIVDRQHSGMLHASYLHIDLQYYVQRWRPTEERELGAAGPTVGGLPPSAGVLRRLLPRYSATTG